MKGYNSLLGILAVIGVMGSVRVLKRRWGKKKPDFTNKEMEQILLLANEKRHP